MSRSADLIADAADARLGAAALQVAVWQLTGQAADAGAPTSDPALNARAAELRALAAGWRLADALGTAVAEVRAGEAEPASATATAGTAEAVRATGLPGAAGPQDRLFARPATLTAEDGHAFEACDRFTLAPSLPEPPAGRRSTARP